jgi:hypothetical protein
MTKETKYVSYYESKTPEERVAYVKANPEKYKPYNQWLEDKKKQDTVTNLENRIEVLEKFINSIKQ